MNGSGWFKSSYSNDSQTCVEVCFDGDRVLVRDNTYQGPAETEPILAFTGGEWAAFTSAMRTPRS